MESKIYFYDKIKVLETLDKCDSIPEEVVEALMDKLKENSNLLNYFVNNIKNVSLINELHKRDFFYELPSPVLKNKEPRRGWVEGTILVRLADQIPEIVGDVVRNIKTDNWYVYNILLQALVKIDVDRIKELWPQILGWLDDCQWPVFPDEYTKICQEFITCKYYDEVQRFFEVILRPQNPPVQETENRLLTSRESLGKFDYWHLDNNLKPLLNYLEDIPFLLSLAELYEKYLIKSIEIECIASNSDFCKTSYWRSAIEDHEQDCHKEYHKDFILIILRDTLEKVLQNEPEQIRDKISRYLNHEFLVFKRLAIHLIRLGKENFIEIAFQQLSNRNILDELYTHHEIFLLLRALYPVFENERQKQIISIIKEGPGDEKISQRVEWHKKNYPDNVKADEYHDSYKNWWIRDRLQMIKSNLKGSNLSYYETLVEKYGEHDHPDFTHYTSQGGFVSQKPPITEEEWNKRTAKECVDLMITWRSKDEIDNYLEMISPEGMASVFKRSLSLRWEEFVPEFERLINQSAFPAYSNAILDHISEELNKCQEKERKLKEVYNIGLLIEIVDWSCSKWTCAKPPKEDLEYGYANSVCTSSLRVFETLLIYLDKNKVEVGSDIFSKIKNIILNLCAHPDPEPKIDDPQDEKYASYKDPIMVSINHIRPMSLRELLRYSVYRSNILNLKEKKVRWEEDVKERVTEMLINDKAFSVRSVFGECWRWLFYLDEDWATKYHKSIFPEKTSDEYFITAWDSYITHKYYVNDPGYDLMRPLYIYAIDNAIKNNVTNTSLEPIDSLSEHLSGFYRFDIEPLRMDGNVDRTNPLEYLYSLKPSRLHSHVVWSMWKICGKLEDTEKCRQIWEKAKRLWRFRIRYVKFEDRNKSFSEELTWFIHFLSIEKLKIDPLEVEDLLTETIPLLGKGDSDHGIDELIKYLIKASSDDSEFSIDLLLKTLEIHGPGFYSGWYLRRNNIEAIIKNALDGNFGVRRKTIKVIHKLGEYGQHWAREYLDKLQR